MNAYTNSVVCADCHAAWYVGQMTVWFSLWPTDSRHYVCPKCFLEVVLPHQVEARLLNGLRDDLADYFGNLSPFRTRLAREIKRYAEGHRPYALVTIPDMEIACPRDGTTLEAWRDYPENPPLVCPCGSRACHATPTGEIACGVLTGW